MISKITEKTISIIVPVYNVEKYLELSIESIVSQTYTDLEIIIVDDGSTDKSGVLAEKWAEKDSRICVYHKENGGISSARNYGIERAHGRYITFVDSDDTLCLDAYSKMMAAFDENIDVVCCGINRVNEEGKLISSNNLCGSKQDFTPSQAMSAVLKGTSIGMAVYNKIYKASLFLDEMEPIRFPVGQTMEEAAVLPQLFKKCSIIRQIPEAGYNYYLHAMSITTRPLDSNVFFVYSRIEEYEENLANWFTDIEDALKLYKHRNYLYLYRRAILERNVIDSEIYFKAKNEFDQIWVEALTDKDLPFREKLMVIETKLHLHILRKTRLS